MSRRATQNKSPNRFLLPTSLSSFQGERTYTFTVPGQTTVLSTTVTTGVLASEIGLSTATLVQGYSRFSNLFEEHRISSVVIEIIPLGLNNGVVSCFFAEESIGTPTIFEGVEKVAKFIKLNEQSPINLKMSWQNRDFSDATWIKTTTANVPAYFYTYTDNANYGAPVTATQVLIIRPVFTIQYRGLKST